MPHARHAEAGCWLLAAPTCRLAPRCLPESQKKPSARPSELRGRWLQLVLLKLGVHTGQVYLQPAQELRVAAWRAL